MEQELQQKVIEKKTPGFSITSIVLLLVSLATPQFLAPMFLVVAVITGLIGAVRKEWGGAPALISGVLSILLMVAVLYNLHQVSTKLTKSMEQIGKHSPFGESDISYAHNISLEDIKGETNFGHLTVKGRCKNNGTKVIRQIVLKVKAYDKSNNVLNSDKVHIFGEIPPGESKMFTSMMAYPKNAKTYNITIEEVRVKD